MNECVCFFVHNALTYTRKHNYTYILYGRHTLVTHMHTHTHTCTYMRSDVQALTHTPHTQKNAHVHSLTNACFIYTYTCRCNVSIRITQEYIAISNI